MVSPYATLNSSGRVNDYVRFVLDQHAWLDFLVLIRWNDSQRVDMLLHSDALF
jgi:hypothetical protein